MDLIQVFTMAGLGVLILGLLLGLITGSPLGMHMILVGIAIAGIAQAIAQLKR